MTDGLPDALRSLPVGGVHPVVRIAPYTARADLSVFSKTVSRYVSNASRTGRTFVVSSIDGITDDGLVRCTMIRRTA